MIAMPSTASSPDRESLLRSKRPKSGKEDDSGLQRRDSVLEDDGLPTVRLGKPTFFSLRLTSDDVNLSSTTADSGPHAFIPSPIRNTWPKGLRERKPGSYAFEQTPTLIKTPWEQNRALRSPRPSRTTARSSISIGTMGHLPREIIHCILSCLEDVYLDGPNLDVIGYRRDLRELCNLNKHWHRVAREHLYRIIWIPWNSSRGSTRNHLAHVLPRSSSSLRLLLRTLEESPGLASMVRRICIPNSIAAEFDFEIYMDGKRTKAPASVLNGVCELVQKCSNLRAISGHFPVACDRTAELMRCLGSRTQLREHVWNLPRSPSDWNALTRAGGFADQHSQWLQLRTLVIWGEGSCSDYLGPGMISAVLARLPSLRHLMLKGTSATDFHNGTLLMLPALESLRLENLPGITDQGLQQLVHSRTAISIESLSLLHLELTSLRTVQALLDGLPRLRRLRLIQETSPELQEMFSFTGSSFSISSPVLEYLHWNTTLSGSAVAILANAIAAGKFPQLHTVKIPCDDDGAIQRLCRPIQQRRLTEGELSSHASAIRAGGFDYGAGASSGEIAAQLRAKRASKETDFSVTVEDEEGVERFAWSGSYLGSLASEVQYCLGPDVDGHAFSHARLEDLCRPPKSRKGWEQAIGLEVLF